jgi:endogenous inhibitor of DNA gyrase (YacG/DUF329 family)
VRCPTCKRETDPKTSKFAPFCSERCKLIDLGRWFADDYRIPGEPAVVPEKDQDDDDDEC